MKGKFFSNQKLKISIAIITIALIIGSVIVSLVSNKKISEEMNNLAEGVKLSAATFNSYSEKIAALKGEGTKSYLYTLEGWTKGGRKRSYDSSYGRLVNSEGNTADSESKPEIEAKWLFKDSGWVDGKKVAADKKLNDVYCVKSGTAQDENYLVLDLYNLNSDENGLALVKEMFGNVGDETGEKNYKQFMWILENMYSIADDTSEIEVGSVEWNNRFTELLNKVATYIVDKYEIDYEEEIKANGKERVIQNEVERLKQMYEASSSEIENLLNQSQQEIPNLPNGGKQAGTTTTEDGVFSLIHELYGKGVTRNRINNYYRGKTNIN